MNVTVKLAAEDKREAAAIELIHMSCEQEFENNITFVVGPQRAENILHAINTILKTVQP